MGHSGVEIEKKYIIAIPEISDMCDLEGYTKSDIRQVYLTSEKGITRRIRSRRYEDKTLYYETQKIRIDRMSSNEFEREITENEFFNLLNEKKSGTRDIIKTRYTFLYNEQLFEIDVYPQWQRCCIMETELESRDTQVEFPAFIRIIRDVTGVKEYSNASMSAVFPPEET